jgi:hypothetical protein
MSHSHPACSLSRAAAGKVRARADLLPLAPTAWSAHRLPAPSRAAVTPSRVVGQVHTPSACLLPLAPPARSARAGLLRLAPPSYSLSRRRPGPRAVGLPAPSRVTSQVRARRRPSSQRSPAKLATLDARRQPNSPPAKMEQGRAARAGAPQRGRAPWFSEYVQDD